MNVAQCATFVTQYKPMSLKLICGAWQTHAVISIIVMHWMKKYKRSTIFSGQNKSTFL